jgi:glycosyltransferase involved in cell wall biosynthesis
MPTLSPPPAVKKEPRPVRVCFLIDELAQAGTETQLLALLRHLDRRRVKPYLCLLRGGTLESRRLEPADCPVLRLGVGALRAPATMVKGLQFIRFLRRHRVDVVQTAFPDSGYFGTLTAWLAGVPQRIRTRNNLGHWQTPAHRLLGRLFNGLTTRTLTNCRAAREALLAAERPQARSVLVLENGVDLERFLTIPLPAPGRLVTVRRVGVVANLRPVKGLETVLEAAARLASAYPDVVWEVAGEGEHRAVLEQAIREKGLVDRVSLPGALVDIPAFLAGLAVAVLPSRAEGMSNALLEYMAAGRPIAATAVGGNRELIRDGVDGLLVPPDDAIALAQAVGRLLDDPGLACRMGTAARRRAQERFSRGAMVHRFEQFYVDLLHAPHRTWFRCEKEKEDRM